MYHTPKITLVVLVYNVGAYLPACLDSISHQTFKDFEVLIVNDGSTDNSSEIIARFKAENPHCLCVEQSHAGLSAARRAGLTKAEGEFLCFLDGDDFLSPNYLEDLYTAAVRWGADLSVARTARWYHEKSVLYETAEVFSSSVLEGKSRGVMLGSFSEAMSLCGKLFRADLIRRVVLPEQSMQEDIFPAVQAVTFAKKIASAPKAVYFYRQNRPGSLSSISEGRFTRLWNSFAQSVSFLRVRGEYALFASYFEYVRWACLLSHASVVGLRKEEYELLRANRKEILAVPARIFKGRPRRLYVRFMLLKGALKYGFSYPLALKMMQTGILPFKKLVQLFRRKKTEK